MLHTKQSRVLFAAFVLTLVLGFAAAPGQSTTASCTLAHVIDLTTDWHVAPEACTVVFTQGALGPFRSVYLPPLDTATALPPDTLHKRRRIRFVNLSGIGIYLRPHTGQLIDGQPVKPLGLNAVVELIDAGDMWRVLAAQ